MSSLLRLLLTKSDAPGTRNVQRDTVALAMDDGTEVEVVRVRDPRARRLRLSVDERGARLTLPPRASAPMICIRPSASAGPRKSR